MENGARGCFREVIDLVSDDDEETNLSQQYASDGRPSERYDPNAFDEFTFFNSASEDDMIDLTGLEDIPDVDVPPNGEQPLRPAEDVQIISEAECLQMVLNVLPDIAVDYVLNLIQDRANDLARTIAEAERLIAFILDEGTYPKERDKVNNRKRKRSDDDDIAEFERGHQEHDNRIYFEHAKTLLKDEFREVPVKHIENTLRNDNTLFKAFNTLDRQLKNYNSRSTPFPKVRARRNNPNAMSSARSQPSNELLRELAAARKKRANDDAKRRKEEYAKRAEEENLQRAQRDNDMTQCLCCFEEYPSNRVTVCNGDIVHFFCLGCAKQYVEHEMGESRCRPVCFATVECKATFTRQQLQAFLDAKSFERLERLQQQEDIRNAGLEDLAECPFCDFKAECPPVEIDKEFRCLNPECGKTSCRLCDKETHIPMSCEEAEKESKVTVRHTLEEAMSKALIRFCNKCKHPFIKEYGCNKMTCTNCRNTQCYICSKDVSGYDHFSDNSHPNRCPLHDNVEARHEEEVKKAEAVALALLRAEHPDISEEELKIQVSDRVKQEEDARRQRAQANHQGFPFQIVGNNLVHRDPNAQPQPVGLQQLHPPIAPGPPPPLAVYFGPGIQPHQAAPAYGNLQPFHNRRINNRGQDAMAAVQDAFVQVQVQVPLMPQIPPMPAMPPMPPMPPMPVMAPMPDWQQRALELEHRIHQQALRQQQDALRLQQDALRQQQRALRQQQHAQ